MLLGESESIVPGMCGVVEDGIIGGYYGYEAGQALSLIHIYPKPAKPGRLCGRASVFPRVRMSAERGRQGHSPALTELGVDPVTRIGHRRCFFCLLYTSRCV